MTNPIKRFIEEVFPPFKEVVFFVPELRDTNYQLVESVLGRMPGVQTPGIDTTTGRLAVDYFPEYVSKQQISDALQGVGFTLVEQSDAWVRIGKSEKE